jgi:acid phosphatase type 7
MVIMSITALMLTTLLHANVQSPNFIHYPYLQIGNQTSVESKLTLVWHVAENSDRWSVRYQTASGWNTITPTSSLIETITPNYSSYSAELLNLNSNTIFNYEVIKNDTVVFTSTAKSPRYGVTQWRLNAFGDCGFGSVPQAEVASEVLKSNPDLIISTGDTVYNSSTATEYETKFWNYYNSDLTGIMRKIPWVAVPGNHDFYAGDLSVAPDGMAYFYFWHQPTNGPKIPANSPMNPQIGGSTSAFVRTAGTRYPNMANFSFDYGNAHIVVLNSNPNMNWTDKTLRAWLSADLKKANPNFWRIVSYHHPEFQSAPSHADNKWMRALSDLFVKFKVDIVLNGHVHNYQRTRPILTTNKGLSKELLYENNWEFDRAYNGNTNIITDGVIRIVTGAGGAPLYNTNYDTLPKLWLPFTEKYISKHSFSQLDFSNDLLDFKQIDKAGTTIDQFVLKRKPKS